MIKGTRSCLGLSQLLWLFVTALLAADGPPELSSADRTFFENRIRPVLVSSCYECHSADAEKIGGKLLLDTAGAILSGGESGPVLSAGNPEESLLLAAMRWKHDLEMPPREPLDPAIIADFEEWIRRGAPDPRTGDTRSIGEKEYNKEALWSFRPPQKNPEISETKDLGASAAIDALVEREWSSLDLVPSKSASAGALLQRLQFDLVGLPASYEESIAFREAWQENREQAVLDLVDRLLDSPQFGERWGRHWLDVARYAESNGNDGLSRNAAFPHAWRYRDYVIDAFNEDVPYDRFLVEQIAGDLLPAETPAERDRLQIATGFLTLGAKPAKAMNNNFEMDVVADQVEMIGSGLLGISIACARCHDHKFDPISAKDYYALAGIFTSTETLWGLAGNEKLTAPPTDLHVLEAAERVLPPEDFVETVILRESATGKPKKIPAPKWSPGTPLAMGVRDSEKIGDAKVNIKGEAKKLGEAVPRGIPEIYRNGDDEGAGLDLSSDQSGRLELARWLTSADHPQTARVYVNRVWEKLFGRGLVDTPNDLGVYGSRPSHPELLDHLALEFVANGWSLKKLIRNLVLTETYQRSTLAHEDHLVRDPENRWLARATRKRLDAEALRDRMLAASGQLILERPEGSLIRHRDILVNLAGNLHQPSFHRSVYLCYLRNAPPPELAAFDLPDFLGPVAKRDSSTRPGQALFLMNDPFVRSQSEAVARRILAEDLPEKKAITSLFRFVLVRDPATEEQYRARELVERLSSEMPVSEAWMALAQSLFLSNEFRYLD